MVPAVSTLGGAPLASIPTRTAKITTPTPSLKSDSPAITSSSFFGAPADFMIPITAMGSVGEISAPKTRQYPSGSGSAISVSAYQSPKPTSSVDSSVPTSASPATAHRCALSSPRLTCRAPANSSNESMPCISTSEKSMERSSESSYRRKVWLRPAASRPTISNDTSNAIAITPIVVGRRTKRWLNHENRAVMTRQAAAMSSMKAPGNGQQGAFCLN